MRENKSRSRKKCTPCFYDSMGWKCTSFLLCAVSRPCLEEIIVRYLVSSQWGCSTGILKRKKSLIRALGCDERLHANLFFVSCTYASEWCCVGLRLRSDLIVPKVKWTKGDWSKEAKFCSCKKCATCLFFFFSPQCCNATKHTLDKRGWAALSDGLAGISSTYHNTGWRLTRVVVSPEFFRIVRFAILCIFCNFFIGAARATLDPVVVLSYFFLVVSCSLRLYSWSFLHILPSSFSNCSAILGWMVCCLINQLGEIYPVKRHAVEQR